MKYVYICIPTWCVITLVLIKVTYHIYIIVYQEHKLLLTTVIIVLYERHAFDYISYNNLLLLLAIKLAIASIRVSIIWVK